MAGNNFDMEEIWALLAQEGQENLEAVENTLLKLEKKPASRDEIAVLFRALHTFKGTVRMMDFSITEAVAHHAEDLVALVRDEGVPLDNEMIDLLLAATDHLRSLLEHILTHHADSDPANVAVISNQLEEMVKLKKGQKGIPVSPPSPPPEIDPLPTSDNTVHLTMPASLPENVLSAETESFEEISAAPLAEDAPLPAGTIEQSIENEPVLEAFIFEPANLAEDPEYVKMFLDAALPEWDQLQNRISELKPVLNPDHPANLLQQMGASVEVLSIASERMGYAHLNGLLQDLFNLIKTGVLPFSTADLQKLNNLSALISQDMRQIQSIPEPLPQNETNSIDFSDLFNHWYAYRLNSDLEQLGEMIQNLITWGQMAVLGEENRQGSSVIETLNRVLGSLYQSCIFYHLDQAAHLTLALEDLCNHIQQEEISFNDSIANLFQTYLIQMRDVFNNPDMDNPAQSIAFEMILNLTQQIINVNSKSPMLQISRSIIDSLDIHPQFKEVLTNENLAEISQALHAGFNFYTILADLDDDVETGNAFQKWINSGIVTPITNISANCNESRCEFIFLITSPIDLDSIRTDLRQIDPQEKYLHVSACRLHAGVLPEQPPDSIKAKHFIEIKDTQPISNSYIPTQTISELTEMVGGLIADQSTLQRVIARLSEVNLTEKMMRLLRTQLNGYNLGSQTWEKCRQNIQSFWTPSETDISTLAKTEVKLNAALVQLQEKTRSLDQRSASEMLSPLPKLGQNLALRQGKQVQINCKGADTELDQRAITTLSELLRHLIAYSISESIEFPDQRQKSNKAIIGQITVTVTKNENHSQVIIEDDGAGLDKNKIMERGKQLGWKTKNNPDNELIAWLFKPEFYSNTEKDINLANLAAAIQSQRGSLSLTQKPDRGLRFTINLLLDTAVVDGMVMRVGEVRYIIPVYAIQRIFQPKLENLVGSAADEVGHLLNLEGKIYPIRDLLMQDGAGQENQLVNRLLVIIEKEPQPVALVVDELIGRQSVLVRPLSGHLANVRNVVGCALLGEGEVGMVLNLETL